MSAMGGLFGAQKRRKKRKNLEKVNLKKSHLLVAVSLKFNRRHFKFLQSMSLEQQGYDAVNQIGTKGGRGVEGFSGDIKKMPNMKVDL